MTTSSPRQLSSVRESVAATSKSRAAGKVTVCETIALRAGARELPRSARRLPSTDFSPHIAPMAKSAKSSPKSKARRPDVYPLGEHLAALLNPALVEKPQGFAEAPQAPFAAESDAHPRCVTGAPAT